MKVLNLYASEGGNTEKVALAINKALEDSNIEVMSVKVNDNNVSIVDILDFDLVFAGSGVYNCMPHMSMLGYMGQLAEKNKKEINGLKLVEAGIPRLKDKYAIVYCTYGGAHTGINEAVPTVKLIGQLFDHYRFTIFDEWYFVGEYVPEKMKFMNKKGRLGDITGRPDEDDLKRIYKQTKNSIISLPIS